MGKTKNNKVVFKDYSPDQMSLLPPSLDELIAEGHPVRIVNDVINRIDLDPLLKKYSGGGTSSYHPRMMLKILVYGYLSNTYTSRKLEAALDENIHFMWLSGMTKVDHNTINRFRSDRLKGVLKEIFSQVVHLLAEQGVLTIKSIYTDGTKIEANANRYTFVWARSVNNHKEKIAKQLNELWEYAQSIAKTELGESTPTSFDQVDSKQVSATINKINEALKDKPVSEKVKKKLAYARKTWPKNLDKYDQQQKLLGKRGSYSKTDPDATFMRLKDDHLQNGQLKPCYNWQISTSDQYVVNYSIHQSPADTTTLIEHLDGHEQLHGEYPTEICADAGYGSEENYEYLEGKEVEAFVKYNYFHKEQKDKKFKDNPFSQYNLHYNAKEDCYYCPMGQVMSNIGQSKDVTATGYEQQLTRYQAQNCNGCPLRGSCHSQQTNRIITVNHRLNQLKKNAKEKLLSDEGIVHRKKRPCDVETVFGNIKSNHGFNKCLLRGKEKVEIEVGLHVIAHNLRKMAA